MVRGLCPRDLHTWGCGGEARTVGNAAKIGQAEHLRLTQPGSHPAEGASRTPPPTAGARHTLRDAMKRVLFQYAYQWCAGCAREILYVGRRTRDGRAVCIVVKIGHA